MNTIPWKFLNIFYFTFGHNLREKNETAFDLALEYNLKN